MPLAILYSESHPIKSAKYANLLYLPQFLLGSEAKDFYRNLIPHTQVNLLEEERDKYIDDSSIDD